MTEKCIELRCHVAGRRTGSSPTPSASSCASILTNPRRNRWHLMELRAYRKLTVFFAELRFTAGKLIPVGKETDRHWEQGEDPSMIDPNLLIYEKPGNMCVAGPFDRKRWSKIGVRRLIRESGFSPTTVYKILEGEPVRRYVLSSFRQAIDKTSV